MKSIRSRFNKVQKKNPNLADYSCLAEAVSGQGFTRRKIQEHFRNLVDIDDYDPKDSNMLVRHLYKVSKQAEESIFLRKNASEATEVHEDEPRVVHTHLNRLAVDKDKVLG